jgi:hypothetical protein
VKVSYDPGPIRVEASQKGWLAVKKLLALCEAIACIETGDPDWQRYSKLAEEAVRSLGQFEQWHGRGI